MIIIGFCGNGVGNRIGIAARSYFEFEVSVTVSCCHSFFFLASFSPIQIDDDVTDVLVEQYNLLLDRFIRQFRVFTIFESKFDLRCLLVIVCFRPQQPLQQRDDGAFLISIVDGRVIAT